MRELAGLIHEINAANGWNVLTPKDWPDNAEYEKVTRIGAILALIHSEVSEALEGLRQGDKENFAEELADVVIRVLDCGYGLGFDLEAEIHKKLEQNRKRDFRHGGKAI